MEKVGSGIHKSIETLLFQLIQLVSCFRDTPTTTESSHEVHP
jgi:hypothetical protein